MLHLVTLQGDLELFRDALNEVLGHVDQNVSPPERCTDMLWRGWHAAPRACSGTSRNAIRTSVGISVML